MEILKVKLAAIGVINALVFSFLPPLFSLLARNTQAGSNTRSNDQIVSGLDIPDRTSAAIGGGGFIWLAVVVGAAIVFYINYAISKGFFIGAGTGDGAAAGRGVKFIDALTPFFSWLPVVAILMVTGLLRAYIVFATNDAGSLIGGSFIALAYFAILLLGGLAASAASISAYFIFKRGA